MANCVAGCQDDVAWWYVKAMWQNDVTVLFQMTKKYDVRLKKQVRFRLIEKDYV